MAGSVTVNGTVFFKDHQQQISNSYKKVPKNWHDFSKYFNLLNETSVIENVLFALKHTDSG